MRTEQIIGSLLFAISTYYSVTCPCARYGECHKELIIGSATAASLIVYLASSS